MAKTIIAIACPVCHGHGTVSKPPWIAGDQFTWADINTAPYTCPACEGQGVILEEREIIVNGKSVVIKNITENGDYVEYKIG